MLNEKVSDEMNIQKLQSLKPSVENPDYIGMIIQDKENIQVAESVATAWDELRLLLIDKVFKLKFGHIEFSRNSIKEINNILRHYSFTNPNSKYEITYYIQDSPERFCLRVISLDTEVRTCVRMRHKLSSVFGTDPQRMRSDSRTQVLLDIMPHEWLDISWYETEKNLPALITKLNTKVIKILET